MSPRALLYFQMVARDWLETRRGAADPAPLWAAVTQVPARERLPTLLVATVRSSKRGLPEGGVWVVGGVQATAREVREEKDGMERALVVARRVTRMVLKVGRLSIVDSVIERGCFGVY